MIRRMNKTVAALTAIVAIAILLTGCTDSDWFGPGERWLRARVNGWDMWATPSVRPYEDPMPPTVEGTVPTVERFGYNVAHREVRAMPQEKRQARAALAYRRNCHHCHGPNGDGRIIVGESLEIKPADLRSDKVQSMHPKAIYEHIESGGDLMVPFRATMSPRDILLTVGYIRILKDKPSAPYYPKEGTEAIR